MNTSREYFKLLIALVIAVTCAVTASTGWAANGKSKGKPDQPPGLANSNGKSVGLVNRLNGNTIDYSSVESDNQKQEWVLAQQVDEDAVPEEQVEEGDNTEAGTTPEDGGSTSPGKSGSAGKNSVLGDTTPPGKAKGQSNNNGQGNASDGLMARIVTNRDIVYTGEALEIGIHFARGAELVSDGLADVFLVIFSPPAASAEGEEPTGPTPAVVVPLNQEIEEGSRDSGEESESTGSEQSALTPGEVVEEGDGETANGKNSRKLFEVPVVDTSEIPAGTYQLGLILTVPGGDPLNLDDWFNGLLGLVHIRGLTITSEALPGDADGDGMMDCEAEIEGMTCEEGTEEEVAQQE